MTEFGFEWGPAVVERIAAIERSHGCYRILRVATDYVQLEIYISPGGRKLRIFRNGEELK